MEATMPKLVRLLLLSCSLLCSACAQERRFTQPNSAMEPTVLEGEKFAVDPSAYRTVGPQRGDLIIFRHENILVLKRVVAITGDTVEGREFQIIVNGTQVQEAYIQHRGKNAISPSSSFLKTFPPTKIPADRIFVMGDNRDFSDDSRDSRFGTIPVTEVLGKAVRIVKSSDPRR